MDKHILNLIIILIGIIVFSFCKQLLEYSENIDAKGGRPVKREVREIRIIIVSLFLILVGIVNLIASK